MKPALPKSVAEHLGKELRAALQEGQPAPAYLGDPGLPPDFDEYLARLAEHDRRRGADRVREIGLAAVEAALQDGGRGREGGLDAVRAALRGTVAGLRLPGGR
jgi:uncharacterized protein (DUF2267 family)